MSSGRSNGRIAWEAAEALVAGRPQELAIHPGYDQSRRYFPAFFAPLTNRRLTMIEQLVEADRVATRSEMFAVHSAEFVGVAPTGRRVYCDIFQIDRIENGVVVQHNATADLIAILAQIGLIDPRPLD